MRHGMQFTGGGGGVATMDRLGRTQIVSTIPTTMPTTHRATIPWQPRQQPQEQPQQQDVQKPWWGAPTWMFLHVMAERVREEYFIALRPELLNILALVCQHLPCPDCAAHASTYLARSNVQQIATKDQLCFFLCAFHNAVNARKGYAPFDPLALSDHYASYSFSTTAARFLRAFQHSSGNVLQGGSFLRSQVAQFVRAWCAEHMYLFDVPGSA